MAGQCKLLDFSKRNERWYFFRIGNGDNFMDVIQELKARVPVAERGYDPDRDHLWWVEEKHADVLRELFPNGDSCVTMVEAQQRLPL